MSKDGFTEKGLQAAGKSPKRRSLEPQAPSTMTAGSCKAPHQLEPGNAGLGCMLLRVGSRKVLRVNAPWEQPELEWLGSSAGALLGGFVVAVFVFRDVFLLSAEHLS